MFLTATHVELRKAIPISEIFERLLGQGWSAQKATAHIRSCAIDESVRKVLRPGGIVYVGTMGSQCAWACAVADLVRKEFSKIMERK